MSNDITGIITAKKNLVKKLKYKNLKISETKSKLSDSDKALGKNKTVRNRKNESHRIASRFFLQNFLFLAARISASPFLFKKIQ